MGPGKGLTAVVSTSTHPGHGFRGSAIISTGRTLAIAGAISLVLSGCAAESDNGSGNAMATRSPAAAPTVSVEPSTPIPAPTSSVAAVPTPAPPSPEASVTGDIAISISVNGTTINAVLNNNAASASLAAQLPLDLSFTDFGGQEKIARIPAPLDLDGMPSGGSAEPGTVGYYAPDQAIVLYYDSVGYYEGIIPLGSFDDVAAVRDAPAFTGTVVAR